MELIGQVSADVLSLERSRIALKGKDAKAEDELTIAIQYVRFYEPRQNK